MHPPVLAEETAKVFNFPTLKKVPKTHGVPVATLHMRAYFPYHVDLQSNFALHAAANLNMPTSGIISLPKTKELVTVIKSPFVHKKSMENFTRITHKRSIKIYDTDPEVLDMFLRYLKRNSVGGVGIKCYVHEWEEFGFGSKDIAPIEHLKEANSKIQAAARVKDLVKELGGETFQAPKPAPPKAEAPAEGEAAAEGAEVEAAAEGAEAPREEAQPAAETAAPKEEAKPETPKEEAKPEANSAPKQ